MPKIKKAPEGSVAASKIKIAVTDGNEIFSSDQGSVKTWTPVIADATTGGNTGTATITDAIYTTIGRFITVSAKIANIDTTGMTGGGTLWIRGLPETSISTNTTLGSCNIEQITFSGNYVVTLVSGGVSWISLRNITSAGNDINLTVAALNSGAADIWFTNSYYF